MTSNERERLLSLARRFAAQYRIMWRTADMASDIADAAAEVGDDDMRTRYNKIGVEAEHTAKAFHQAHDMLYEVFGKQLGDKPLLEPPQRVAVKEEVTDDD